MVAFLVFPRLSELQEEYEEAETEVGPGRQVEGTGPRCLWRSSATILCGP